MGLRKGLFVDFVLLGGVSGDLRGLAVIVDPFFALFEHLTARRGRVEGAGLGW